MSVNGSGPDASDAAEKFADDLGEKLNNPTGGLTTGVKIVDDKGNDTGKTKPRFILQSHGYYDVKAYVAAGLVFPKDAASFQGLHPKEGLQKLLDLDPSIYQQTQDAMVGVYTSCNEFNKNALPNFRLITLDTKEYSNYAIMQLTGLGEGSFQGMLDILTSDKYATKGSEESDEFKGAAQSASDILLDLSETATVKATKIAAMVKEITTFQVRVENDKKLVDGVVLKFQGDGTPSSGYVSKLNTSLAELRKGVQDAVNTAKEKQAEYDHDDAVATGAIGYIWIPIAGWIAGTTVLITYNNYAKAAWAEYQRQLGIEASKNKEVKALEAVISDVNLLANQNKTMSDQMKKAITALGEIQKVFEQLAVDLGSASSMMGAADKFVRKGLWQRKNMIRSRVNDAVKSWQDALEAATELLNTDGNIKTEGATPDVTPPKID
ncbi:hypothetical protein GTA08_BOTSDO06475 [Botryosphaeria dothidea]|uniref:Uncharacterized protein n=1 Tax=Botryosphaeria dothidea TaxID=55169 RepID=A0A8H4IQH1_9PEZI|nr:hypothetical protein GTA08_BOTSDO06475 [Botryosphaeria dothidea]